MTGDATAGFGLSADGLADEASISIFGERSSAGLVLNGAVSFVHEASSAALFLLAALIDGEPRLVALPADSDGLVIERRIGIDLTRRYGSLQLEASCSTTTRCSPRERTPSIERSASLP